LLNDGLGWIDERFPLSKTWNEHLAQYYAPKNFNFWYYFGSLALVVLVIQFVTGIWLTMNYKPSAEHAFASVEYIMRDVDWGWWIRYMHSTGASAFFIIIYLHMFRGLLYGSFKRPRELLWLTGMFIYLILMAEAFFCIVYYPADQGSLAPGDQSLHDSYHPFSELFYKQLFASPAIPIRH